MRGLIGRVQRLFGVRVAPRSALARKYVRVLTNAAGECERRTGLRVRWPAPVAIVPAVAFQRSRTFGRPVGVNARGNVCEVLAGKMSCALGPDPKGGLPDIPFDFLVHDFGHVLEFQHGLSRPADPNEHDARWANVLPLWHKQKGAAA